MEIVKILLLHPALKAPSPFVCVTVVFLGKTVRLKRVIANLPVSMDVVFVNTEVVNVLPNMLDRRVMILPVV